MPGCSIDQRDQLHCQQEQRLLRGLRDAWEGYGTSCQHLSDPAWQTGWLLPQARENSSEGRSWMTAIVFMINSTELKDPITVKLRTFWQQWNLWSQERHINMQGINLPPGITLYIFYTCNHFQFCSICSLPAVTKQVSAPWEGWAEDWDPGEVTETHPKLSFIATTLCLPSNFNFLGF